MINLSEAQLLAWITPLLWPFIRALALLASLPAFAVVPLDSPLAFMVVAQQVLVGVTLGFAVRLVFAAVELGGELIGLQMGLNFAGFFDPATAAQGTASSRFFGTMVAFLFVLGNGHLMLIQALVRSFEVFVVGDAPLAFLQQLQPQRWGAKVFMLGLWIALPLVGMLLFVNLVLGLISRVAPQISVFSVGFPITLSVGLIGMLLTLPLLEQPFAMALQRLVGQFQ